MVQFFWRRLILLIAAANMAMPLVSISVRAQTQEDTPPTARMAPAVPFDQAHSTCLLPAVGRQVFGFGERTHFRTASKGLVIETRRGAQVVSPCDGWVVVAGEFESYGKILIINAGQGYHFLLAGFAEIDVEVGQFLLGGEPVGVLPRAPDKQGAASPVLYVELRSSGQAIDPSPWWRRH